MVHHSLKQGTHPFQPALIKGSSEPFIYVHGTNGASAAYSDLIGVFLPEIQVGIFNGFLSRNDCKLGAPREAAGCLGTDGIRGLEIFYFSGILAGIRGGIEMSDRADPAPSGNQGIPKRFLADADRGYDSDPCDRDAFVHFTYTIGRLPELKTSIDLQG
jgi:hypothetical protein